MNIRIVGFLATALALLIGVTWHQVDLYAFGCDAFGYARQAELFRTEGLPRGLDTRIDAPEARFLIAAAQSITSDSAEWSEAVAPHCHHYNSATGRIILEYPPGTGLILSIFPETVSFGLAFLLGMALVSAVFVAAVVAYRPNNWGLAGAFATLALIEVTTTNALASASLPVSIALIPLCALLTLAAFPSAGQSPKPGLALLLGVAGGLLLAVRLANIFLLVGLACAIVINQRLWRTKQIMLSRGALAAAIVAFTIPGLALVLAANWVNAGSPFSTTYAPVDASAPVLAPRLIGANLCFYFGNGFAAPIVVATLVALILRGLLAWRFPTFRHNCGASIGASVCYFLSLAYFCTHDVRIPYYMLPASAMTLCLVVFEILAAGNRTGETSIVQSAWLLAPIFLFALIRCLFLTARLHTALLPNEVRDPRSIVWADLTSGTALYYQGKYAAKINFADPCMQDRLILKVFDLGRSQYFIEDSKFISKIVQRLSKSFRMIRAGVFDTGQKIPIWKIEAKSGRTETSCDDLH